MENGKPLTVENVARVCHEANRAFCFMLGDRSHHAWDSAPDWQRKSAIAGVKEHLKAPWLAPRESHWIWMAHKMSAGWKYGPVKDEAKMEHPCMLPWEQLPLEQRAKDVLFSHIVAALAPLVRE